MFRYVPLFAECQATINFDSFQYRFNMPFLDVENIAGASSVPYVAINVSGRGTDRDDRHRASFKFVGEMYVRKCSVFRNDNGTGARL